MDERRKPEEVPERRDHTPRGRVRRILFDHRRPALTWIAMVAGAALLFVATSAWAVDVRYERSVAEMTLRNDTRSLAFVRHKEAELTHRVASQERQLAAREEELAPKDRAYLVVSLADRQVVYLRGNDTLFRAPVAIGSGKTLVVGGRTMRFVTPRGRMSITNKELDPVWVPPTWYYVEYARRRGMRVVDMSDASPGALAGYPAGRVPVSGNTVIIPPWGSPQRAHHGELGVAKLEMYDGYYFHGTDNPESVGQAASHGCLRMSRGDIMWMYEHVPLGTAVYIY
jgi:lipoprotein-anchoring transpeptidase ErfK/SrfK